MISLPCSRTFAVSSLVALGAAQVVALGALMSILQGSVIHSCGLLRLLLAVKNLKWAVAVCYSYSICLACLSLVSIEMSVLSATCLKLSLFPGETIKEKGT